MVLVVVMFPLPLPPPVLSSSVFLLGFFLFLLLV
jgi:hypothetical protein